jgi:hypothetical protein
MALDGGGCLTPRPRRFTPEEETRYVLYRRLGGLQGRSERVRKNSPLRGFDPPTVQPVASRYTDSCPGPHDDTNNISRKSCSMKVGFEVHSEIFVLVG